MTMHTFRHRNLDVQLELTGSIRKVDGHRDLAGVTLAIQKKFPHLVSLAFGVNAPVRFVVKPERDDSLESLLGRRDALQASLCADGILDEPARTERVPGVYSESESRPCGCPTQYPCDCPGRVLA